MIGDPEIDLRAVFEELADRAPELPLDAGQIRRRALARRRLLIGTPIVGAVVAGIATAALHSPLAPSTLTPVGPAPSVSGAPTPNATPLTPVQRFKASVVSLGESRYPGQFGGVYVTPADLVKIYATNADDAGFRSAVAQLNTQGFQVSYVSLAETRLDLASKKVRAGGVLHYSFVNDTSVGMLIGDEYQIQAQAPGWKPAKLPDVLRSPTYDMEPGATRGFAVKIPAGLGPGNYRLTKPFLVDGSKSTNGVLRPLPDPEPYVSAQFTVTR